MERKPNLKNTIHERFPFPREVVVETSSFCNLSCVMCPYPRLRREKGVMELAVFKKIVDEIMVQSPDSNLWIAIMGEPLAKWEALKEKLRYAKEKGFHNVNLNTNGTYLTKKVSEELLELDICKILFSLDAFTKETYGKIRVGGDYELVKNNIETFLRLKQERKLTRPEVIMQFIIMDENESEWEAFKEYWLKRGAVVKVRLKLGWGQCCPTEDLNKAAVKRDFPCPWLLRTVSIHWSGILAQCDADYEGNHKVGDIKLNSIKEIWDTELEKRRQRHWAMDFSHPLCSNCKDWSVGRSTFYYPEK